MRGIYKHIAFLGIGAGLLYFSIKEGIKRLVVDVYSYSFAELSLVEKIVRLNLNLRIKNTLPVGVNVKRLVGKIYMQGSEVGYVDTKYNYYIDGFKTHVLPVVINLDLSSVKDAIIENIKTGDVNTLKIEFVGNVQASKDLYVTKLYARVPVNLSFGWDDIV